MQSEETFEHRGLTGIGWTDQRDDFAGGNLQIDPVQHPPAEADE